MEITRKEYDRLMFTWAEERVSENMSWFQTKRIFMTNEQRELYRNAYMTGWADAVHLAHTHGYIKIKGE